MSTKALISILVCEQCVIGTLTHPGVHVCTLLEFWSQPLVGNINSGFVGYTNLGADGAGAQFFSASIKPNAACVAALADDVFGMFTLLGKNSTMSAILSCLVLSIWTL
eukprot:9003882-Ditylum_brightwellii.AAC.1